MLTERTLPLVPAAAGAACAGLLGTSEAMDQLRQVMRKVARTDATLLIRGEYGSGKRRVAAVLHRQSPRAQAPFIRVDCAGLPAIALEHELFGHEKAAAAGGTTRQEGLFELADGGTILLEEISGLTPGVQAKLMRVLQEGTFERTGGKGTFKTDVRLFATTNRDLEACIQREEFREDLFLRLNIVPVLVPPLRDHKGDIPLLAEHFRLACARSLGAEAPLLSPAALSALENHAWPGNVRELQQRVELAVVTGSPGGVIDPAHLGVPGRAAVTASSADKDFVDALPEMEKRHIFAVLERCKWNRGNAATRLGISIRTLRNKLNEYQAGSEQGETDAVPQRQP